MVEYTTTDCVCNKCKKPCKHDKIKLSYQEIVKCRECGLHKTKELSTSKNFETVND